MGNIEIFKNEEFGEVRTLNINNEPWFVGKDVSEILGYSNSKDALKKHVDEEDKQVIQRSQFATLEIPNRGMTIINESGLYSLILSSKLPNAKKFKHWVTSEVLPNIRKHGAYMTDDVLEQAIENPDFMIGILQNLKKEKEKVKLLQSENNKLVVKIEEDRPKLEYIDTILNSKNTMTVSQIAKDYDLSAVKLNKILHGEKIQYKCGNQWLLYADYVGKGYTKSSTYVDSIGETRVSTKWTQKGRLFLHEILTELGYVAILDRN